jgi:type I restriction enzyme S subunit
MRPYLRVANVLEDRLDLSDVTQMNFTPQEFETFSLKPGDILLNEGQAPDLLGRPALYLGEIVDCCFQKTLLRFRARALIDSNFALLVFRHYMHSGRFRRESRITTNIDHLTQVRFVEMEFPLPPPAEAAEILRRVEAALAAHADTLTMLDAATADAARLRQAILKSAFAGRLVPQDADDEPASATLARLKANPSAAGPARRGRKKRDN